jgi:hypothetical protein
VEKKMVRIERAKETETTDLKAKLEAASADLRQQLKVRCAAAHCWPGLYAIAAHPAAPAWFLHTVSMHSTQARNTQALHATTLSTSDSATDIDCISIVTSLLTSHRAALPSGA